MAVEAVVKEGLSYNEAARIYGIDGHDRIQSWERGSVKNNAQNSLQALAE